MRNKAGARLLPFMLAEGSLCGKLYAYTTSENKLGLYYSQLEFLILTESV